MFLINILDSRLWSISNYFFRLILFLVIVLVSMLIQPRLVVTGETGSPWLCGDCNIS